MAEFFSIAGLGRGAPERAPGFGPPGRGPRPGRGARSSPPRGPGFGPGLAPGLGIPCEDANGLLPGREPGRPGFGPGLAPGLGIPCEDANGLLPGREPGRPGLGPGFAAPGFGTPGLGAPGLGAGFGASAPGFGVAFGAAGCAGFAAPSFGVAGPGFLAAGALAPGLGAPGFGAEVVVAARLAAGFGAGFAADLAGGLGAAFFAVPPFAPDLLSPEASPLCDAYTSFNRRTTGASTVEEAERTNSPIDSSFASTSLLVVPSSLASSWTRGFATFLLSGLHPDRAEPTTSAQCSSHCSRSCFRGVISERSLVGFHFGLPAFR